MGCVVGTQVLFPGAALFRHALTLFFARIFPAPVRGRCIAGRGCPPASHAPSRASCSQPEDIALSIT